MTDSRRYQELPSGGDPSRRVLNETTAHLSHPTPNADYVTVRRTEVYSNRQGYDAVEEEWFALTWREIARQQEAELTRLYQHRGGVVTDQSDGGPLCQRCDYPERANHHHGEAAGHHPFVKPAHIDSSGAES